jgi:hypothetical protein
MVAALPLFLLCMSGLGILAQGRPTAPKGTPPLNRSLSLATILSCEDDPLLGQVFKTDGFTARIMLNGIAMVAMKFNQPGSDYSSLLSNGYYTRVVDDSTLEILPIDVGTGITIAEPHLPFCHDLPTAHYSADTKAFPHTIEIDGSGWTFDPNEVFAHADQFHFESGVFSNGTDIYLTASKGPVSVQFLCKPQGLRFYRVLYLRPDLQQ